MAVLSEVFLLSCKSLASVVCKVPSTALLGFQNEGTSIIVGCCLCYSTDTEKLKFSVHREYSQPWSVLGPEAVVLPLMQVDGVDGSTKKVQVCKACQGSHVMRSVMGSEGGLFPGVT